MASPGLNRTVAAGADGGVETETVVAEDGGHCRLTWLTWLAGAAERAPVLMLAGMFTGRRFWLSDKGVGLAAYLAERGHPVAIVDRRGLADARADARADAPSSAARAGLDEHLYYDLPAIQRRLNARFARPVFLIGHSFGGVLAARAVAESLDARQVAGLVLFASQFEVGKRMLDWPGAMLTRGLARLAGRFPARAAGLGPENEPAAAMVDATRWVSGGRRNAAWPQALARITAPVLAISGKADRVDPSPGCARLIERFASTDRRFIRAGRDSGYAADYDHPGIVISKPAQAEIWPLVADWLDARDQHAGGHST